jgi:endonuclease/exonuclease/phosphatase family metal-dependent hydrolase
MSDWNDEVIVGTIPRLTAVPLAERAEILAGPIGNENHRGHFDRLAVLREIEAGGAPPSRQEIDGPARVAFWNVELLRHIDAITETLKSVGADVNILCEIDRGMARTQNTDRMVDLAGRLDLGYLYAVEFVELGLGDVHEQVDHAGEHNDWGFHGAGLLSAVEMGSPFLIRLDDRGNWFDGALHERRVGGTIAIGAKVRVMGRPVTMISVHLESHCDPAMRAGDMQGLLERIETIAPGAPVVLGGDFNTSTAGPERWLDRLAWLENLKREPERLSSPERFEPLFAAATRFGYTWQDANVMGASTQRFAPGSTRPNHKLDWFFTRGVVASRPEIIAAVRRDGSPSSDHECLAVTVAPLL